MSVDASTRFGILHHPTANFLAEFPTREQAEAAIAELSDAEHFQVVDFGEFEMDSATCCCCGEPAPIRGKGDPWEGRLDGYCVSCATTRCDTTDSTCAVKSVVCVCGEINMRHCPVHGQGETANALAHRIARTAVALLNHDDTCRDFACVMRDGCPERQTLMDAHNEATNDYARLEAAT